MTERRPTCRLGTRWLLTSVLVLMAGCQSVTEQGPLPGLALPIDPGLDYVTMEAGPTALVINRDTYREGFEGFWLRQSIGNWTGLITEMDKIGGPGEAGVFYRGEDWLGPDQPAIWADTPSPLSPVIDFVLRGPGEVWGADDD
ncbi:MAG: ADP-ribosylglycohydrolase family protein, partial [Henriciella sp.]